MSVAGDDGRLSRMKNTPLGETLLRVQEIVARETGRSLGPAAERELASVLTRSNGAAHEPAFDDAFSSREVTILIADVRGFTAIAASHPADALIRHLNDCLVDLTEIAFRHQGTVDKYMGDAIMVLFGAPEGRPDDVRRAIACAVEMQQAMRGFNLAHQGGGLPEMFLGIGISTGTVMAGNLGSKRYSEYTVIGDEVNVASRIVALTLRGQVLVSQGTYDRCADFVETGEPMDIRVKGKSRAVSLREVVAIPSLGLTVPRQENRRSHRVAVELPLRFNLIVDGIVLPETHAGTVRDLGHGGLLVEVDRELPLYSEIRFDLDLPLAGHRARDVYARTVFRRRRAGRLQFGAEFTSLDAEASASIQVFIQLLFLTGAAA